MIQEYLQIYKLSIVIIGEFNPAIVTPFWLAHKKLIREQEASTADLQIIHSNIAKFSISWAEMEVQKNRMELATTQEGLFDSLRDLAVSILNILKETPITALGINHLRYFTLPTEDRYHELGRKLGGLGLWEGILKSPKMYNLEIGDIQRKDKRPGSYRVRIQPSDRPLPTPYAFLVNFNDHYDLPKESTISNFTSILSEGFNASIAECDTILDKLWTNLSL